MKVIKEISYKGIEKLLKSGVIKNTAHGYVNKKGSEVGYYKTCGNKRYIQDKYVDMLENLK